jgi:hypothetical protein
MMALISVEMCLWHPEHAHYAISYCPMFNIHWRIVVVAATTMSLSLKVSTT